MKIGITGCGFRVKEILKLLLKNTLIEITGIYDINTQALEDFKKEFGEIKSYENYETLLDDSEVDWVFIGSINSAHKEHIVSALNAGKNIFCEKPIATTFDDLKEIKKAFEESNSLFLISYPLRYSLHYRKIKEIINNDEIGEIISVEFNETLDFTHGAFIMSDWRRLEKYSGGHLLEKCCHDLDLINWFIGSLPKKVASFGGLNFFNERNKQIFNNIESEKLFFDGKSIGNPFISEKSIIDNQVVLLEYNTGVRATFHTNCSSGIPERRMYICGTKGTIRADIVNFKIEIRKINSKETKVIDTYSEGSHAGGDKFLVEELKKIMIEKKQSNISMKDAICSAVTCFAIEEARKKEQVINLNSIWEELGIKY